MSWVLGFATEPDEDTIQGFMNKPISTSRFASNSFISTSGTPLAIATMANFLNDSFPFQRFFADPSRIAKGENLP